MKQIKLEIINEITHDFPSIYLADKSSDLSPCGLSDAENQYVRIRIDRGDEFILVHRLSSFVCLVINDATRTFFSQLESLRKTSLKLNSVIKDLDIDVMMAADLLNDPELLSALMEGLLLGNYRFSKYGKTSDSGEEFPGTFFLFSPRLRHDDIVRLQALYEGVCLARDLVNEPLSHLNAERLSERIQTMADSAGFTVEVMKMEKIRELKMGGLLAVNRGSTDPPTFTILEWKPDQGINEKPFVIIGKGIVFDTGGLSLKPTTNSMDYMKSDMAGAAAVAGTFYALALSRLPVHVIGLIPATDNRPGANAIVPGDVITMYDGSTVEVMNTDAEGRLILADALSWAKQYDPALVIDLATLTGSAAAAVGPYATVAMEKSADDWYESLEESGFYTHERLVKFPLWEDYMELLKSDIADMKNIGGKYAGSITAGKFLEHFTSFPWIHLDIAGPAFLHSDDNYRKKGGTAVGVRLLFDFFSRFSEKI
jgi:leucyl aminopeptidase